MKIFLIYFLKLWLFSNLAIVCRGKIVPQYLDPGDYYFITPPEEATTTTTATPQALNNSTTTTTSPMTNNNTIENFNAMKNFSVYDHNHKFLLVVLSDLNVRKVNGDKEGKLPNETHIEGNKLSNETFLLDESKFKELLEKLHTPSNKDGGTSDSGNKNGHSGRNGRDTKCDEANKCYYNIAPHYVPPTFPLIIRREEGKPIAYIESISCDDNNWTKKNYNEDENDYDDELTFSHSYGNKNMRKPPKIDYPQLRSRKRLKNRRRSRPVNYVLVPKQLDVTPPRKVQPFIRPLSYMHNVNYAHSAEGVADPRAYYWSTEEDE